MGPKVKEKKQFRWNDIRHENIRSNMLIAIIRYANNKRHFIIFDLSCAIIPSSFHENKKLFLALFIRSLTIYCFQSENNNRMDHKWVICFHRTLNRKIASQRQCKLIRKDKKVVLKSLHNFRETMGNPSLSHSL